MALFLLLVGNKIFQPTTQTDSDFISRTLEKWVYYCAGALRFIPSGGCGGGRWRLTRLNSERDQEDEPYPPFPNQLPDPLTINNAARKGSPIRPVGKLY